MEFDIIYVVCTYGATEDLKNFIASVDKLDLNTHIIVANSYCNDETRIEIKRIAEENNCDFLDLENKGYGHSLNEGIQFAEENYMYKCIAITNADIIVKRVDLTKAPKGRFVVAPEIITKSGKRQNPFYIFPHFKLFKISKWYREKFRKKNSLIVVIVAKIERITFNILYGKRRGKWKKIYAGHGAHILFSKDTIKKIQRPFEDDIFLYCEENFLGYRLQELGIPYYYTCDISVIHTEDGSQAFYKHRINDETEKSMRKYHELIKNK